MIPVLCVWTSPDCQRCDQPVAVEDAVVVSVLDIDRWVDAVVHEDRSFCEQAS